MEPFQGNIITLSERSKRAHASMTAEARLAASEAGKAHGHLGGAYGHLGGAQGPDQGHLVKVLGGEKNRKWQADDDKLVEVCFTGKLSHTDAPTELAEKQARDSQTWHQNTKETQG